MITHEIEQRSDDWFELRRGKVTSSKAKVLMSDSYGLTESQEATYIKNSTRLNDFIKGVEGVKDLTDKQKDELKKFEQKIANPFNDGAKTYAIELAGAEHQEFFEESYISSAMQDGIDTEPIAVAAYEAKMMCEVTEVGFVSKDETEGSSPDGLVGNNGQIEIKCPGTANHLRYLMSDDVPSEHYDQVQHQLYVTQRTWCDFVSFNPYFKQDKQLKIIRAEVDPKWVEKYKQRKAEFDKLVNEYKQKLK